jgi:chromatin modification-related protein EAF6
MGEGDESVVANEEFAKQSTPAPITTIAVPPALRTQELSAAQAKKIKDREYQRRKRANMSHRSTGESDEEAVSATSVSSRRPTKRARLATDDE